MTNPSRSLLFGLILGAAAIAGGCVVSEYFNQELERLVAVCETENQKPASPNAPAWAKDPLVCDFRLLNDAPAASNNLVGVQARIVEAQAASLIWSERSRVVGLLLFGIFAIPYCWHFLLRRIVEVRQALLGR